MFESRRVGSKWRRIVGTLLFDASFVAAAVGIARMVFGVSIDFGPWALSLGSGGPWPPFILAAALFFAAASLTPVRHASEPSGNTGLGAGDLAPKSGALGSGSADFAPPVREATTLPPHRAEH